MRRLAENVFIHEVDGRDDWMIGNGQSTSPPNIGNIGNPYIGNRLIIKVKLTMLMLF